IGEIGPAGKPGEKGDIGEKGDAGEIGPKGDIGATGAQGPKGDTGAAGLVGLAGEKGEKGETGETGPKGEQGEQGIQGEKGDTGETGPIGKQGEKGDTGEAGKPGEKGEKGDPATNITTNLIQDSATGTIAYTNEISEVQKVNVVSSDANNGIDVGSDGGAYLKINHGARWTNRDTDTNLNVDKTTAPIFGNEDYNDNMELYQVRDNKLVVRESGRYDIRGNISLMGANSSANTRQRTNANARIAVNGVVVGARAASGYIRYASNQTQSSIHLNEILHLKANDVISIVMFKEANSGAVKFSASGESSFMINKLK
ncbi:MAG: hypothetical protein ACR2MT_18540, partial [Aurantibacter sp.]